MARTQAADYEAQREAILDHAAEAFAAGGYAACTMADIAARSGASKARLYHYYPGKEAILFDLLERHTRRLADIVEAVAARALAPRARLDALIAGFLDVYRTSRTRHMALLNDVGFLGEAQRETIVMRERALVGAFGDALAAAFPRRVRADNRRMLTMLLMGAMNWTFTWLKPDAAPGYADYAKLVSQVIGEGLAGAPPARARTATKVESRNRLRIQ